MKRLLLFFCFLLVLQGTRAWEYHVTLEMERGVKSIDDAQAKSRCISYIAEIPNPVFPELPRCIKVIYYRKYIENDHSVNLRADFYDKDKILFSFLSNSDGQFAMHASGVTAEGGDFLRLFHLESLTNRMYTYEQKYSNYTFSTNKYNGRACTIVTANIPKDIEDDLSYLMPVMGLSGGAILSRTGENGKLKPDIHYLQSHHPYRREFWIDNETGCLLNIRKYSLNKELLSNVNLGKVNFTPDWSQYPDLFLSPAIITCHVSTTGQFFDAVQNMKLINKTGFEKKP